jgi:hypothetical protein
MAHVFFLLKILKRVIAFLYFVLPTGNFALVVFLVPLCKQECSLLFAWSLNLHIYFQYLDGRKVENCDRGFVGRR